MIKPASASPEWTAWKILSKGTTTKLIIVAGNCSQSCSAKKALVMVPGTAILVRARSARLSGFFATSIGP
jgi:hypothetical protein